MRVYLTKEGKQKLEELKNSEPSLKTIKVETDGMNGEDYVDFYTVLGDPTMVFPAIPTELITRVTSRERIDRSFVKDGIYKYGRATLMAKFDVYTSGGFQSHNTERVERQFLHVSAPNLKTLNAIYSRVLQGKIKPKADWNPETHQRY